MHVAVVANPPPSKSENPAQLGSHQELATDTVSIVGLTSYPNIPILRSHVYPRSQGTADSAHADFWIAGIGHSGKFPERGLPRTNPKVGSQVSHCAAACSESGNKKPGCETHIATLAFVVLHCRSQGHVSDLAETAIKSTK